MSMRLFRCCAIAAILALFGAELPVTAQPYLVWQRAFYEDVAVSNQIGYELQQTTDGGFIIGGLFGGSPVNGGQFYLVKTDAAGNWQWTGDRRGEDTYGKSVRQTSDGGYIMAGYQGPYEIGSAVQVMKFTSTGGYSWQQNFQIYDNNASLLNQVNAANCIRQTSDGGYILTGYTKASTSANRTDLFLAKLTSTGAISWIEQWEEPVVFCADYSLIGHAVEQTSDGGYIIAAEQVNDMTPCFVCLEPPGCIWSMGVIIKTNSSGNEVWKRDIQYYSNPGGFISSTSLKSVQQTADGGYIATGYCHSYIGIGGGAYLRDKSIILVKLDANGDTDWIRVYNTDYDEEGYCVKQTADDGYIISGMHFQPYPDFEDAMLLHVDGTGQIRWAKRYGWPMTWTYKEYAYSVVQTFDGVGYPGFTFAGLQQEWQQLDTLKKVYLVQTSPSGNSAECKVRDIEFDTLHFEQNVFDTLGSRSASYETGSIAEYIEPDTKQDTNCIAEIREKRGAGEAEMEWTVVGGAIDLSIYPNPVGKDDPLLIRYRLPEGAEVRVVITDVIGRPVYVWQGTRAAGEQQEQIVPAERQGWYTISVYVNGVPAARSMVLIR